MVKVKDIDGKKYIWDKVRKKYVVLIPEELQRQFLVDILTEKYHYPASLISIETGIKVGKMKKRFDLLILDNNGNSLLLAECKAENVKIDKQSLIQLMTYNKDINAPILILFNGNNLFCWELVEGRYIQKEEVPSYSA